MFRHLLLCVAVCVLPAACFSQSGPMPRYALVRIELGGRTLADLARLGIEADHGEGVADEFFQTELSETEIKIVQDAGFQTQIIVPDVLARYQADLQERAGVDARSQVCPGVSSWPVPKNYSPGSMGGFHTYAEMLAVLDDMASKYPQWVKPRALVSETLRTHENRPLWYVKISDNPNQDEQEAQVLYTALHHAREPNSMAQMLFFMWYLLEHQADDAEIRYLLEHEELYFIPCVNPDGYLHNESIKPLGGGLWRKNRRINGDGVFGVDLNRNYGFQWGIDNQGSSPNISAETYRGPSGFSEPETRMVRDFCEAHHFSFVQNYHTKGNLLIYPWAYNATVADSSFIRYARLFTKENHYKTGITFETVGYAVNGSAEDWMLAAEGITTFTPEVGRGPFWPLPEFIIPYNQANVWQNLSTALCALRFGLVDDLSANYWSQQQVDLPMRFTRYGLEDGAFQVSLQPLTPNVSVLTAPVGIDLQQFKSKDLLFQAALSPGIQVGEEIRLLLKIESGAFSHTDTLRKYYGGQTKAIFYEDGSSTSEWTGTWKTTTSTYVSPPSCITDSPGGKYANTQRNDLSFANFTLTIPTGARQPLLRFWAKWDIEDNRAYVAIFAETPAGDTVALCGRYTNTAATAQGGGDFPIYDGLQPTWVEECMDLSDFIGQPFSLRFRLVSNALNQFDGFYFDDLRVEYTDPTVLNTLTLPLQDFDLRQNEPNPAHSYTTITWQDRTNGSDGEEAVLEVFNVLGQPLLSFPLDLRTQHQTTLDVRTWPAGTYTYHIRTTRWQSPTRQLVVVR